MLASLKRKEFTEKRSTLQEAEDEDFLLLAWPGQWRRDIFSGSTTGLQRSLASTLTRNVADRRAEPTSALDAAAPG
jgi:hypothetical protein